ncbi:hypothetical protein MIDIC_170021 [Alphaproteobacteria bacterium]
MRQDLPYTDIAKRMLIQVLVASTLSDEGRILYHTFEQGKSTYEEIRGTQHQNPLDYLRSAGKIIASGSLAALETVARIGLNNVLMQSMDYSSNPHIFLQVYMNFVATEVVLGAFKGLGHGATAQGTTILASGFDSALRAADTATLVPRAIVRNLASIVQGLGHLAMAIGGRIISQWNHVHRQ